MLVTPLGPAWLLITLGATRFAGSPIQILLNRWLGRRRPIGKRDRFDWALLGVLMTAIIVVSALDQGGGGRIEPSLLIAPLLPYSLIQLRQCRRSYAAHVRPMTRPLAPAAMQPGWQPRTITQD